MGSPPALETPTGQILRLLDHTYGTLLMIRQIQGEVRQAHAEVEAVRTGEGMEEEVVGEGSIDNSSSEDEGEDPEGFQDASEDFFA
jgi:hypothetical protein